MEVKQQIRESNCEVLQKYNRSLADALLYRGSVKVNAAITIQKHYRAYVAKTVYSRLLADKLNQEEEAHFQAELMRITESSLWIKRSKLKQKSDDNRTIVANVRRRREQSAVFIQRYWRQHRTSKLYVPVDFDSDFISTLTLNFPSICEQYSISTSGMVFQARKTPFTALHATPEKIVRKIVPTNNNTSLFSQLQISDSENYTLEIDSERPSTSHKALPLSDFDTPIAAKRTLIETSYVFEKELREDFSNPFYIDSEEEEEEEEMTPVKLCSYSSESHASEESLISGPICDSGYEDDRGKSASPPPRTSRHDWDADEEAYYTRRDIYTKPAPVQMCFVEEKLDGDECEEDLGSRTLPELGNKRWSAVSQCHSESNISPNRSLVPDHKRNRSYGGEDVRSLKGGWATSAHLMTTEQLTNWLNVMHATFAKTNLELVERLAEREELQEQQDMLLQKIFAVKSVNENGGVKINRPQPPPASLSRRISSIFAKP